MEFLGRVLRPPLARVGSKQGTRRQVPAALQSTCRQGAHFGPILAPDGHVEASQGLKISSRRGSIAEKDKSTEASHF